ncbi:MAG: hypothetical protein ACNA78_06690 [Balneolaceae bacterium]
MASQYDHSYEEERSQPRRDPLDAYIDRVEKGELQTSGRPSPKKESRIRQFVKVAAIVLVGFFLMRATSNLSTVFPFSVFNSTSVPNTALLDRMGTLMTDMGYTGLSHDELRNLRSEGVTATYISNIRALGYDDLTLDQAVMLAQANVSTAFMAMMLELGYEPTIEEFATMRRAGVTANYTSRLHDLGYANVPMEQLIRLQRMNVSISLVEQLQRERGADVSLEEIIRHRISNQ